MKLNTKIKGCLFGGACGDALGYPVEFAKWEEISGAYDNDGIKFGNFKEKPLISDDTQMTLFTADGLLMSGDKLAKVWRCYQDWLDTQFKKDVTEMSHEPISSLVNYPELFASREPGRSCLQTIAFGKYGTLNQPVNHSKGCGGVMRVAPVGLLNTISVRETIDLGVDIAALTHGHPLSSISAGFMAGLIRLALVGETLRPALSQVMRLINEKFSDCSQLITFQQKIKEGIRLTASNTSDRQNISQLGGGWVAEETLAIALYSALKYNNDPQRAVEVAVNHDGDSDSTGALTGQILGAFFGDEWLPVTFIERLDAKEAVANIADKLGKTFSTETEGY